MAKGSTIRTYYFLAGQRVALRKEAGQGDDVFWFHTDHLGSTSRLTNEAGLAVITTTARYKPFGGYRTTPTADVTDHGFTGHPCLPQGKCKQNAYIKLARPVRSQPQDKRGMRLPTVSGIKPSAFQ